MLRFTLLLALIAGGPARAAERIYDVNSTRDGILTGGATLVGALPYLLAGSLINFRCPCNPNEVNAFDRGVIGRDGATARVFSDVVFGGSMLAAILVDGLQTDWKDPFLDDMLILAQVMAVNSALVSVTKVIVQRPLPITYAGGLLTEAEGYRSFYSGHTASTAAALAFLAYTTSRRQPGVVWPWVLLVGGTIGVGVLRIEGGRHFPTDVIVGAVIGSAIGIVIPALHRRKPGEASWFPVPIPGGAMLTMGVRW